MKRNSRDETSADLVVDFAVPAALPSRYRARLVGLSRRRARLLFAYVPSPFRDGRLRSCRARLILAFERSVVQVAGRLRFEVGAGEAVARIHFDQPVALGDLAFLRRASGLDRLAEPAAGVDEAVQPRPLLLVNSL